MNILLGISGGIAAYKSLTLVRELRRAGATVRIILTENGARFVTPLSCEALSGQPVYDNMFARRDRYLHITLREWADQLVIAPATANCLGKLAHGLADDLLSATALAFQGPRLLCPAMNNAMWEAEVVQQNLSLLRERGWEVLGPVDGSLACGIQGAGRMQEPEKISSFLFAAERPGFCNRKIVITAGATREPLDEVRFLSNPSSGKMGVALARAARARFARVVLIHGHLDVEPPAGVVCRPALTVDAMLQAVQEELSDAAVLVMAAAVSDFRFRQQEQGKIKKAGRKSLQLQLESAPDILQETRAQRAGRVFSVGFAMECEDLEQNARHKLESKGLDCILANPLGEAGAGFASDTNRVLYLDRDGTCEQWPEADKIVIARRLLELILAQIKE